jgi:uncharacterized membrane protein YhaH (DUF805 family)
MRFGEAFTTCMHKYADFSGRARRSEWWWFYLALTLIQIPFSIAFGIGYAITLVSMMNNTRSDGTLDAGAVSWAPGIVGFAILLVASLALTLPSLAAQARRLHDMGQTGLWLLLGLVGLGIVPLIMCILDTQPGTNQWGPDPKADERVGYGYPPAYPTITPPYPTITPPGPPAPPPFI